MLHRKMTCNIFFLWISLSIYKCLANKKFLRIQIAVWLSNCCSTMSSVWHGERVSLHRKTRTTFFSERLERTHVKENSETKENCVTSFITIFTTCWHNFCCSPLKKKFMNCFEGKSHLKKCESRSLWKCKVKVNDTIIVVRDVLTTLFRDWFMSWYNLFTVLVQFNWTVYLLR